MEPLEDHSRAIGPLARECVALRNVAFRGDSEGNILQLDSDRKTESGGIIAYDEHRPEREILSGNNAEKVDKWNAACHRKS